jgi:hypothetical protein
MDMTKLFVIFRMHLKWFNKYGGLEKGKYAYSPEKSKLFFNDRSNKKRTQHSATPNTKLMRLVETSARDVTLKLHQLYHYQRQA